MRHALISLTAIAAAICCPAGIAHAEEHAGIERQMRIGTVDFVVGSLEGQCGCPSVISRNRKQQMVLILGTKLDERHAVVLKSLQAKSVDAGSVFGHFVLLPAKSRRTAEQQAKLETSLAEFAEANGITRFELGVRRASKSQAFKSHEIPDNVEQAVYLLIDGRVATHFFLTPDDDAAEKAKAIGFTANALFEDRFATDD